MSLRMDHDAGSRHAAGLFSPAATHRPGDGHALLAPVLVLNASYEPINVCAARRALVLVLKGVAMTEEENGHFLHAARIAMRVPSVIRLKYTEPRVCAGLSTQPTRPCRSPAPM